MRIKKISFLLVVLFLCFTGIKENNVLGDEEVKYKIRINIAGNYVSVYEIDNLSTPVKMFTCSSINNIVATSVLYQVEYKQDWAMRSDGTYAKNVTVLNDGLCISTVPYSSNTDNSLIYETFNRLGEEHSKENILLKCADAKWIYENCSAGTEVEIFSNENASEMSVIPDTIKIPENSENKNWDPSDDAQNNPWKNSGVVIEGARNIYIRKGEQVNVLQGLKGYDTCGNDITDKIILMGNYDNNKIGEYEVSYYLQDAIGSSAITTVKIIVRETKSVAEIGNDNISTEKSNKEKVKIIILIGIGALAGTVLLIRHSKK